MSVFSPSPSYRVASRGELMGAAMDLPFSPLKNLGEQFRGGVLDSFGLGTVLKDFQIPRSTDTSNQPPIPGFNPIELAYEGVHSLFGAKPGGKTLSQDDWKASPYYREELPWDAGMTEDRAAALALFYDQRVSRQFFGEKDMVTTLIGGFGGAALDPVNFIPVFGPAARAAATAKAGFLLGHALIGASEAAINTAAFGYLTAPQRAQLGDDVSLETSINNIAFAGVAGLVFGGIGGAIAKRAARVSSRAAAAEREIAEATQTIRNLRDTRDVLNDATVSLATRGEVDLQPKSGAILDRIASDVADRRDAARALEVETRGITGDKSGEVVISASGARVRVQPEVVELATLQKATGALQVRDRSRQASDAWIEETATRLDPALLMPAINADKGAPLVGSDNIIDSGNGRTSAIARAYAAYPDRAAAYRKAIEDAGYSTEGMTQPVLINRRLTELSPDARAQFNADSQGDTARMSATELASMDRAALDESALALLKEGPITSAANRGFVDRFLANLPASERGSLVDERGIGLNADGQRRIENALVAAAYGDVDAMAVRKFAEATDDNTRSIVGAMSDVAGAWVRMRRAAKSGAISAELDQTPELTEALRRLSGWREQAAREGRKVGMVIKEGMGQLDVFTGEIPAPVKVFIRAFYNDADFTAAAGRDKIAGRLFDLVDTSLETGVPDLLGEARAATKMGVLKDAFLNDLEADLLEIDGMATRAGTLGEAGAGRMAGPDRQGDQGRIGQGGSGRPGAIRQLMSDRFAAGGRPRDEAEAAGAMVEAFYQGLAQRSGITVDDLVARFGLPEVRAADVMPEGALAQSTDTIKERFRRYMQRRTFKTREEAESTLRYYIDKWNKGDVLGQPNSTLSYDLIDEILVRRGGGFGISQKGLRSKPEFVASENPIGEAPKAAWGARDLQDYRKGAKAGEVVDNLYVSIDSIPKAKLAGGKTGYDWSELERGGAIPPVTLRRNKNGSLSILDGNHRIEFFRERGFDSVPAYVIRDANAPAIPGGDQTLSQSARPGNPAFDRWFGNSKVVDENGEPLAVYHGTTADFEAFDPMRANPESDLGAGIYFSNTPEDVAANYAGEGPDLSNKIERRAEQIAQELSDERGEEVRYDDPEVVALAKEQLGVQHGGATMPVYLAIENPVVLGGDKPTHIDGGVTYNTEPYMDEARQQLEDDGEGSFGESDVLDRARELAMDNGDERVDGGIMGMIEAIDQMAADDTFMDININKLREDLMDETLDGEDAARLIAKMKMSEGIMYAADPNTGDNATPEVIRRAFEAIGYDGFIDHTVDEKFGSQKRIGKPMAGMNAETVHYIAFRPEQVKSKFNRGTFDPADSRILFQPAYHGTPHIFDKFDSSKIGTGEGAQAFGHGLYFAGRKEVAEYYRKALTEDTVGPAQRALKKAGGDIDAAIAATNTEIARLKALDLTAQTGAGTRDAKVARQESNLAELTSFKETGNWKTGGRLLTVDIPDDSELMVWDAPLSEQPHIEKKLRDMLADAAMKATGSLSAEMRNAGKDAMLAARNENLTGEGFYRTLSRLMAGENPPEANSWTSVNTAVGTGSGFRGDAQVSAALREAGIPGHRFLDQQSRVPADKKPQLVEPHGAEGQWEVLNTDTVAGKLSFDNKADALEALARERAKFEAKQTYNYVIYDDSRVNVTGFEQQARGAIQFGDTGSIITLLKNADASTALHESSHHFLMMFKSMAEQADAPLEIARDWSVVKDWWGANADRVAADSPADGVTGADVRAVLETGTTGDRIKDLAINVGLQEQWARGFERYAADGVAPTEGLRAVFAQFKDWLRRVYRALTDLRVDVSPEVKGVFDRLLGGGERQQEAFDLGEPPPRQPVDMTKPAPEPRPDGIDAAAARVSKPEEVKALAEQFGVKDDGTFAEEAEIEQMRATGRLTPEDEAALAFADQTAKDADAWAEALRAASACVMG